MDPTPFWICHQLLLFSSNSWMWKPDGTSQRSEPPGDIPRQTSHLISWLRCSRIENMVHIVPHWISPISMKSSFIASSTILWNQSVSLWHIYHFRLCFKLTMTTVNNCLCFVIVILQIEMEHVQCLHVYKVWLKDISFWTCPHTKTSFMMWELPPHMHGR